MTDQSTLTNVGNAAGIQVIQIGSTAAVGLTVSVTNDGLWKLQSTISGALQIFLQSFEPGSVGGVILQLGNASYVVEGLGNLQVDGNFRAGGGTLGFLDNTGLQVAAIAPGQFRIGGLSASPHFIVTPFAQTSITANGQTITRSGTSMHILPSGGSFTGIIMSVGVNDGEMLILLNDSLVNTLTFAATATSHVGGGVSAVLSGGGSMWLMWNNTAAVWENSVNF